LPNQGGRIDPKKSVGGAGASFTQLWDMRESVFQGLSFRKKERDLSKSTRGRASTGIRHLGRKKTVE